MNLYFKFKSVLSSLINLTGHSPIIFKRWQILVHLVIKVLKERKCCSVRLTKQDTKYLTKMHQAAVAHCGDKQTWLGSVLPCELNKFMSSRDSDLFKWKKMIDGKFPLLHSLAQ